MTFLILKISGYLVLALLAGLATGWSVRHISASNRDEEMQRTLADARARVPQFETLIRSRDVQISHLKEEIKDKNFRINSLVDDLRASEAALKDGHSETGNGVAVEPSEHNKLVGQLKQQLEEACAQAADAMSEAAAAESELVRLKEERMAWVAQTGSGEGSFPQEPPDQRPKSAGQLKQTDREFVRISQELELEQRRVLELERERELQNKSLQVLHQQLEMEREQRERGIGD